MLGSRYSVYQIRSYVCMQFVEVRCFIHNQLRWPSLLTSFNSSLVVLEYLPTFGVLMGIWVESTLSLASIGCLYKVQLAVRCGSGLQESYCLLCLLTKHCALKVLCQRSYCNTNTSQSTPASEYIGNEGEQGSKYMEPGASLWKSIATIKRVTVISEELVFI